MPGYARPFKFTLPQELVDRVIDTAEDDFQSLKNLGLVGTQWSQRTREHLFKKIRLMELLSHPLDPTARCKRLLELLEAKSDLGKLPRTLVIRSSTTDDEEKDLGWLQICSEDVIKILKMLRNVSVVALQRGGMDWNFSHLPSPLRVALHSFITRPKIIELCLLGVHSMEMTPLVQCCSIQRLLMGFTCPPSAELKAFFPLNVCRKRQSATKAASLSGHQDSVPSEKFLRYLNICGAGYALYLLLLASRDSQATLDFSRIKKVRVGTIYWDDIMAVLWPYFLEFFCQNVEHYCVTLGPVRPLFSDVPDGITPFDPLVFSFAHLPRLERLDVEVPHYSLPFPQHNPIPHLLEALETLSSSTKPVPLKTLAFEVNFASLNAKSEPVDDVTQTLAEVSKRQDIWGRLDEILSRRQVFSHLTSLTVHMVLNERCKFNQSVEELDELKNVILSYMPNLGEQSKVKVAFHLPSS